MTSKLTQNIIQHLENKLKNQGLTAAVHFELEGVFEQRCQHKPLNYQAINNQLRAMSIDGELKTEYWRNQWEYVSLFNGQSPLKEAQNLANAMRLLPALMCQHGAKSVSLVPVAWGGDKGRYLTGSNAIFSLDSRSVHIPNAIQMNLSVVNAKGENLFAQHGLGEWIQYELLVNSYACCLLFLPEEDAFKRLTLKQDYGLDAELSSPVVLSGGHRGSVALYREWGKHNQPMGLEPMFFAHDNSVLHYSNDWQKTARIEHRIGATSQNYDPFLNTIFILLNVLEGIRKWQSGKLPDKFEEKALPTSLYDLQEGRNGIGALSLFKQDKWWVNQIDCYCHDMEYVNPVGLGEKIKDRLLNQYRPSAITVK